MRRRVCWSGLPGGLGLVLALAGCAVEDGDPPACPGACGQAPEETPGGPVGGQPGGPIDVPGPAELLPPVGDGAWEIVRDERFFVGYRGVSPEPVPALAVSEAGEVWIGVPTWMNQVLQVAYARRVDEGTWELEGLGTPAYQVSAAVNGSSAEAGVRLFVPRSDDWRSEVWRLDEAGGPALEETLDLYVFRTLGAAEPALIARDMNSSWVALRGSADGWEAEGLIEDPYVSSVAAAAAPDGRVGAVYYDWNSRFYRLVDTAGTAESIASANQAAWWGSMLLAYDADGEPWVVLPDDAQSALTADFSLYRRETSGWMPEVLASAEIPPVTSCPDVPGEPCALPGESVQAVALVAEGGAIVPVVQAITQEVVYERECLTWEPEPMGCAMRCADEGGPQGAWIDWPQPGAALATTLVIGGQEVSVPGEAALRATGVLLDRAGRLHVAAYEAVDDGPEMGDDLRYLVLQRAAQ